MLGKLFIKTGDLVFHGNGVGGKEFSPYGYTIVDHPKKKVYKGSEVVPLKELLEYMPLSREEKEKDIDFIIDALIERNHLVTTEELNRALAKEVDARVWNGSLYLNGNEQPLRENHARILPFTRFMRMCRSIVCSIFVLPSIQ